MVHHIMELAIIILCLHNMELQGTHVLPYIIHVHSLSPHYYVIVGKTPARTYINRHINETGCAKPVSTVWSDIGSGETLLHNGWDSMVDNSWVGPLQRDRVLLEFGYVFSISDHFGGIPVHFWGFPGRLDLHFLEFFQTMGQCPIF